MLHLKSILHSLLRISCILLLASCGTENLPDVKQFITSGDVNQGEQNPNPQPTPAEPNPTPTTPEPPSVPPSIPTGSLTVDQVLFAGSSWKVPAWNLVVGSGLQLRALQFNNIDTIIVKMSDVPTDVTQADFILRGDKGGVIDIDSIAINNLEKSMILNLASKLPDDWYTLIIRDEISLANGTYLDGDWQNPVKFETDKSSRFPSGDEIEGGDFELTFGVLPGNTVANDDASNRQINQEDVTKLNNHILEEKPYSQELDLDGNGVVDSANDLAKVAEYSRANLQLDEL